MKTTIAAGLIKGLNFMADAITGKDSAESSGVAVAIWKFLSLILNFLWNNIMTVVHFIAKFALNLCDLIQFFIQKLIGLDFWNSRTTKLSDIGESDVLFRFLMSDQVLKAFRLVVIVGIVLIIVFSIVAIIRSEYATATSGELKSKKQVLVSALKSIFLIVLIPLMLIFGVLASNAILASLINAISPDATQMSLGSQIFTASAYNANRYRLPLVSQCLQLLRSLRPKLWHKSFQKQAKRR